MSQNDPTPNSHPHIADLVINDMKDRKAHGIATYGTPLQILNGRDALQDLYEELLDATVYIKQEMLERDRLPRPGAHLYRRKEVIQAFQLSASALARPSEWPQWMLDACELDANVRGSVRALVDKHLGYKPAEFAQAKAVYVHGVKGATLAPLDDWLILEDEGLWHCSDDMFKRLFEAV